MNLDNLIAISGFVIPLAILMFGWLYEKSQLKKKQKRENWRNRIMEE